jgi:hypothetical protein
MLSRRAVPLILPALLACARPSEAEIEAAVAQRFPGEAIVLSDPDANFFGFESRGASQVRGNGALVLVESALWFQQVAPDTESTIALADVRAVDLVDGHLGKSVGRKLLHVRFRAGAGEDAAAWYVDDPEAWRAAITTRLSPGT